MVSKQKRKQHSDKTREEFLARISAGEGVASAAAAVGVAINTAKRWIKPETSEKVKQAREDAKVRFVEEAWDTVMKGIAVGNTVMSFALENKGRIDEAVKAVLGSDLEGDDKVDLVNVLAGLSKFSMRELAIYIGTIYDKIALANGKPTGIHRVEGQVTDTHEYKVTQEIVAKHPELLDVIFARDQQSGLAGSGGPLARPGMGELH